MNPYKKARVGEGYEASTQESIPDTFTYKTSLSVGFEDVHCHYVELQPTDSTAKTSGETLKFIIPASKMIDFNRAGIYFKGSFVAATGGAPTYTAYPRPINAIFESVQSEWQERAENTLNYQQMCSILERNLNTTFDNQLTMNYATTAVTTNGSMIAYLGGNLTQANRSANAPFSRYFFVGLKFGHLSKKVWPMGAMDSTLTLYFLLTSALRVMETDGDNENATFSISEVRILAPQYDLPKFYANSLLKDAVGGLKVPYPRWKYQADSLVSGFSGEKRVTIQTVANNVKHVIVLFRQTANTTTQKNKNDKLTCFERPSTLDNYFAVINGEQYPNFQIKAVDNQVMSYIMKLWGQNKWNGYTSSCEQSGLVTDSYLLWQATTSSTWAAHIDFDDFPQSSSTFSGINTSDTSGKLEIVLNFSAATGATYTIDVWMISEDFYVLKPNDSNTKLQIMFPNKGM